MLITVRPFESDLADTSVIGGLIRSDKTSMFEPEGE